MKNMDFANINLEKFNEISKEILLLAIKKNILNRKDFEKIRNATIKKHKSEIFHSLYFIKAYQDLVSDGVIEENPVVLSLIQKRTVRTMSGVAPVTVLTKPFPCPGKCVYCPTDLRMPKSYLPSQPAAQRAYRQSFNPYTQVFVRLKALFMTGHDFSKIELRIIGGSFSAYPKAYQKWFIKRCLQAMNEFAVVSKDLKSFKNQKTVKNTIYGKEVLSEMKVKSLKSNPSFDLVVKENETSLFRCIGINVETRPDLIDKNELKYFRTLGITKVEMGVQTLFDKVQEKTERGHDTASVVKASSLLKDFGFKLAYHMMPNLPYSTPKMDKEMFDKLFDNSDFKPDYLKIYPCVVVEKSRLSSLFNKGVFRPYSDDVLIDVLKHIIKSVPYYCRVDRVARDIPATDVKSGLKTSNIRQIIENDLSKENIQEIRYREIKGDLFDLNNVHLLVRSYEASKGKEVFLSFEDEKNNKLLALLRLRFPHKTYLKELKDASIIREVHVYGKQTPVGEKSKGKQHIGFGRKLLKEAEYLSKQNGCKFIAVISGIGVRQYYEKFGYKLKGTYMVKEL